MPEPGATNRPGATPLARAAPREAMRPEDAEQAAKAISRALRRAANKSRTPTSVIAGGGGFKARRGDRAFRAGLVASFVVCVVIPVLAASIYWGLIASKQYVTEAKFALKSADSSSLTALGAGGGHGDQQMQDAQVVADYIRSRAMVEALDKKLDLRAMYSRPGVDYFSAFDPTDPMELLEKYWKKRVDASFDMLSGIISVHVRAFTPQDSLAITQNIVEFSEQLVNELSTRSRRDALAQARAELTRAEERLKSATATMRDARNAEGVLDAPTAADAINKIITQLRFELSAAQESLALQASAAATDSPQVRLLQARVSSLKKQIADYSAQIASADNSGSLAGHAGVLSERQVDLAIAQQQYALASTAYENARVDLESRRAYLSPFLRPTLAEKSIYPRRWIEWSIIVAPATLGWAILVALAFLVRDHMAK